MKRNNLNASLLNNIVSNGSFSIIRLTLSIFRLDYLKSGNLFADDVKKEHDMEERKQFKESLIANREKAAGSDLGLW